MPQFYLLTSLWGGQDGSLLWWLFLLSIYTAVCVRWLRGRFRELQPYIIATLMVPLSVILVPLYSVISAMGLFNSLWGVILPTVATPTDTGLAVVEAEEEMTIKHLLTHTSGISYGMDSLLAPLYAARGLGPSAGPGWYTGEMTDIPALLDRIMAHLDTGVAAEKPIIISEIGAGAIPGWRDAHNERWTEQYQARLLEAIIRHLFVDRQRVCGLSIWLYNDFRTPASMGRPRGFNDKGVVDEYRRPKAAYAVVRQLFRSL